MITYSTGLGIYKKIWGQANSTGEAVEEFESEYQLAAKNHQE